MIWKINHVVGGRETLSCRRSTTALTGSGMSEPSLLNTRCNVLSVPTIWPSICVSELMRSAHRSSTRRWKLNGYVALIRTASLTRSRGLRYLGERSRQDTLSYRDLPMANDDATSMRLRGGYVLIKIAHNARNVFVAEVAPPALGP
jgi:hypothetical protein